MKYLTGTIVGAAAIIRQVRESMISDGQIALGIDINWSRMSPILDAFLKVETMLLGEHAEQLEGGLGYRMEGGSPVFKSPEDREKYFSRRFEAMNEPVEVAVHKMSRERFLLADFPKKPAWVDVLDVLFDPEAHALKEEEVPAEAAE